MDNIMIITLWQLKLAPLGGVRRLSIGVYAVGEGKAEIRAEILGMYGGRILYKEVSGNPEYTMEVITSLREVCRV